MDTPTAVDVPSESSPASSGLPDISTPEARQSWLLKGTPTTPQADSAPAKTPAPEKPVEPVTESGTESQDERHSPKAEKRIKELLGRIKELERTPVASQPEAPKAEPKPKVPEVKEPTPPVEPEWGTEGQTWGQYQDALRKYRSDMLQFSKDLAGYTAKVEYDTREAARADETKKAQEATEKAEQATVWAERRTKAEANHADFLTKAFSPDVPISPVMDAFIVDSEIGPELLYYFGDGHQAEAVAISTMHPIKAARALTAIEMKLAPPGESAGTPEKPITQKAPPPPTNLGGRGAIPPDPIRAAIEAGDTATYIRLQNEADLSKRRRA